MARRSPQKKKNKAGTPKSDAGASVPAPPGNLPANADQEPSTVNWLSGTGPAISLAPESEPWTPAGHRGEWERTRSPLRSPTKPLEQQVSSLQAQREAADADLWNARVELQDHAQQKEADRERIAKLTAELSRLRSEYDHDFQALDELRSREEELQASLERERTKAARDRQSTREQLEDRDGFIETLQSQLDGLREELKSATRAAAALRREHPDDTTGDISSTAGDITSITVDSDLNVEPIEPSEVPHTTGASELLSQTHQARQQRSLRAALQKQRLENFQLKQQLAELKGAPTPRWEREHQYDLEQEHSQNDDSLPSGTESSEFFTDSAIPEIPSGVPLSEDFVDEPQLERQAHRLNLAVVPEHELSELRHNNAGNPSDPNLDSLSAQLRKKYDAHVVPADELEALRNPDMDFLHHHANAINHRLVPIQEYEEMRNTQAVSAKLKLTDDELKLAYELLRGRRKPKSKVQSHVLQDLARSQALGLASDISSLHSDLGSRDPSISPSRGGGRHNRSASHSSSISDFESAYGDAQHLTEGVGTALRQVAQNYGFELVSDTVAGSRELAQRHGLATVPLESLAVMSGSKILQGESAPSSLQVNDVMLSLTRGDFERIQAQLSAASPSISKEELSELQRRAYTPTTADITEQAAALGLAVLPLDAVAEMKGRLNHRSVPDASSVAELAQKAGLRVIPEHPTLDEIRELAPEDAVLVERDTWAALEYPEPATLRRLAKVHGLAILPEEEVERLEHRNSQASDQELVAAPTPSDQLSVDQLREAAQAHDLIVLSADDYRDILTSRQARDFSHLPMAARTEHFEKLIKSSQETRTSATSPRGSPSASSLGSLSDRITRLGFVPVEQEEYRRLLASQKVYEPTKSDILRSAKQLGLAVMPLEDALRLRASHWNSPNKSKDGSFSTSTSGSPRAGLTSGKQGSPLKSLMRNGEDGDEEDEFEGFKAVPTEYLSTLRRIVEHPTRADIETLARKAGMVVGVPNPTDDEIILRAQSLGLDKPMTDDDVRIKATALGLVSPMTDDDVIEKAKYLGLSQPLKEDEIIQVAKAMGLAEPLTETQIVEHAKSIGLSDPISDDEIVERAAALGMVHELSQAEFYEKARSQGLIEPLSDSEIVDVATRRLGLSHSLSGEEIIARATDLGLVHPLSEEDIIISAKSKGLVDPLTEEQIKNAAKKLGLVEPLSEGELISAAKSKGLVDPLSGEQIKSAAKKLGLVEPLSEGELISAAKSKGLVDPLSEEQIKSAAKKLGLVEPLSEGELISAAKSKGLVDPLSEEQIKSAAKKLGLVEPLSEGELISSAKSRGLIDPLSEEQIKNAAKKLGLVEPLSEGELISAAKSRGLIDPLSEEQIKNAAKKLGLVEPLSEGELISAAKSRGLVDPLSEEQIKNSARKLGLVDPLSDGEFISAAKSKGLVDPLSEEQIKSAAKNLGLVEPLSEGELIGAAKSRGLIDPLSEEQIKNAAKKLGLVEPLSDDELIGAAKSKGLVDPLTEEQIKNVAKNLGLVEPLSEGELIDAAKAKGLMEPLSEEQIKTSAKNFGLAEPLSESALIDLARAKGFVEPLSEDQIKSAAKNLGLVEPLSDSDLIGAAKAKGLIEPLSDDQVKNAARKLGLVEPLSEGDLLGAAKAKGLVEPLSDSQIRSKARALGLQEALSETELIRAAKAKGLTEPIPEARILEIAKTKGLVEPFSEEKIRESARKLGMVEPLSGDEIMSAAKEKGLIEPLSEPQIISLGKARGLVEPYTDKEILDAGKSRGLVEPLTKSQILESAKSHGLAEPLTIPEIKAIAQKHGLVEPYSDSAIIAAAKNLGLIEPLSNAEILGIAKAEGLGEYHYHAEGAQDSGHLPSQQEDSSETFSDAQAFVDAPVGDLPAKIPRSHGFILKSDQNREPTNNHGSHSRTTSEVPSEAAATAIGPRASRAHDNAASFDATTPVTRKPVASSDLTTKSIGAPPIPERIRANIGPSLGLNSASGIPNLAPRSTTGPISEVSDSSRGDPSVVYGPEGPGKLASSGLPQNLGGSPVRRDVRRSELPGAPPSPTKGMTRSSTATFLYSGSRSPTKGMSRSSTSTSLHSSQNRPGRVTQSSVRQDASSLPMPRSNSVNPRGTHGFHLGSLTESVGSSWAVETVTGEAADQYMSQLVVGEVLYKYKSGFSLEGITSGRHKRYFWFRPDSMSLYWHRENPHFLAGLYGPAKHITVVGVEEIHDRNPIPAGLFHRSILIRGRERDLRVTCSTASRHRVWCSSLRYAIAERNPIASEKAL